MTIYAFCKEEHLYSGTGTNQNNTYYYSLAGRLVGELTGTTPSTSIFLTDALGSVLTTFSNAAGTAKVLANQVYGPYGSQRYSSGTSMGTDKGFTGQYTDPFTGLDYYNARYYDPAVGVFISADKVQGNPQGMNPYAYVGGNPETKNDPTGNKQVGGCDPNSGYDCPPTPPPSPTPPPTGCHGDNHPWCDPDAPPPGCTSGCKTSGPPTTSTPTPKPKPTPAQINNARSTAGSASSFFFGLAFLAGVLSRGLFLLSEQLLQWGCQILLTSVGPWAFLTIPLGLSLLALGAAAGVLAWQATKLTGMLGTLGLMYLGENRMPDSWWTSANVQGFGIAAGSAATAVGVFIDFASFFSKLPGKIASSVLDRSEGALVAVRGLGTTLGFFSGEAIARQINYYTGLETNCLTQSSCATS